jgi:sec-independent protein translocase protein TatC
MASDAAEAPAETRAKGEMTVLEHLGELRAVLLQCAAAAAITSTVAWFFSAQAVDFLVRPAASATGGLVFLSPTGAFMLRFRTAIGVGLMLAAPFIVWRAWSFVVPGLLPRERRALLPIVVGSLVLFYAGAAFAYLVILPTTMTFLLAFGTESLKPMISGEQYFGFALRLSLAFGAVFQLPLVVALLTWWEVLGPDFLQKHWRWGVVSVFVVSAILTPPDVASQLLMAGPVLVLYLVAMVIAKMIGGRRRP